MIGTTLGRYPVCSKPSARAAWAASTWPRIPRSGGRVAIKVLPPAFAADPERRDRLLHEARAASALNHPNIVTVYDVGDEGRRRLFVAMERVDGGRCATGLRAAARAAPRSSRSAPGRARRSRRRARGAGSCTATSSPRT